MAVSNFQIRLEKLWYKPQKSWWLWLFYPLHLILKFIVYCRRFCYRVGLFKSTKLNVPVVVIGNINVGGTGKTPLAIYLLKKLQLQGFRPGLVTRGYGGKAQDFPFKVEAATCASIAGDEPVLIYRHTQAAIMVDPIRSRGGQALISDCQCDIIICDDGLQHYALQRDLELLVVDNERQFGNGLLMPLGPLREPVSRSKEIGIKVFNGLSMLLKPQRIQSVLGNQKLLATSSTKRLYAVAGIGNPQRFYQTLNKLSLKFSEHSFPDHHPYQLSDFSQMDGIIIMTEKDAVKCHSFADERFYYLPIEAELDADLSMQIMQKVKQLTDEYNLSN